MSDPQLQVRIYDIDWVFASPGPLDNSNMRKAPVLRIFGDSSVGIKTCVHVHQVYPYFYVEYMGKLDGTSGTSYIMLSGLDLKLSSKAIHI
jgi:DNA polymerase zeta